MRLSQIATAIGVRSNRGLFASASLYLNFTSGNQTLDPRITFSRGSNATLTDNTGKIAYAPHNLLTYSEQFDNAAWSKNAVTISANASIAPDGLTTADKVEETAVTNYFAVISNPAGSFSTTYTWSCYAKASERNFLALNFSVSGAYGTFNLTTGVSNMAGTGFVSAATTSVGNGWWRLSVTLTTPASGSNVLYHVYGPSINNSNASYAGTAGSGIYIWGAQLNVGALQPYYPTTSAAYYGPRFDYDPVTLQPKGLLIEEQRTNLLTYSEQFDNAAWSKTNSTVTANTVIAPDGTLTADKFETTGGGASYLYQGKTLTQGQVYTLSVYVKNISGAGVVWLRDFTEIGNAQFDLANGVLGSVSGIASNHQMVSYGNGWYRISAVFTPTIATGNHNLSCVHPSSALIGNAFYAWGAQLEAGAFPTSYIPTTTAQATRAADVASMTGTNFSSWWNATEGSIYAEFDTYDDTAASRTSVHLDDTTVSNRIMFNRVASRVGMMTVTVAGVNQVDMANGPVIPYGAVGKVAGAYKTNDFAVSSAGTTVSVDTLGTLPPVTQMGIGCRFGASNFLNGHLRKIAFWPRRLSDSELKAITS